MKKMLGFVFSSLILFSPLVYAENKMVYTSIGPKDPLVPATIITTSELQHGLMQRSKDAGQLPPRMPMTTDPSLWRDGSYTPISRLADDCNMNAMAALTTPYAVVNYVKTHTASCMYFLWNWDSRMANLFTTEKLTAVVNEIATNAPNYLGTNAQNMQELLFFTHLAYYHSIYHTLNFNEATLKPIVVSAFKKLHANSHIFDNNSAAGYILNEELNTIDTAEIDTEMLTNLEDTLDVFLNQYTTRLPIYSQQLSIYTTLFTIARSVQNGVLKTADTRLINLLKSLGLLNLQDAYQFVANNSLWALGQIADKIPAWKPQATNALETAYNTQPKWSAPWLWAVRALTMSLDCVTLSTGQQVCLSQVKEDLKAKLFPSKYEYENGIISVKTALTKKDVDPLYYATKEVKAQFARAIQNLTPVPNDPNTVLNVILYNSLSDYSKYHTFLFNLDSNNGGIYIEQDGTYYTYQRTSSESIYTLQELARHEYTHYLVGRYLVEGMWGVAPIYANNRMVFFDEGLAEYFAGSTPKDNVAMRASLVKQIKSDGTARMTIAQVLTSTYGDFKFYRYAGMFFHFLANKHLDMLKQWLTIVRAANISGFDNFKAQLMANTTLNTEYQNYLTAAVQNIDNIGTPTTVAPQDSNLVYSSPAQIQSLLLATRIVPQANCTVSANATNILFNCNGQITGASQSNPDAVLGWFAVNDSLNQLVKAAQQPQAGTNFDWLTCWFDGIQWTSGPSGSVPTAQYSCDGPLGNQPPLDRQLEQDFRSTRLGKNAVCRMESTRARCDVPSSTSLVTSTVPDSELLKLIDDSVSRMRTDVYNISPTRYAKLACITNQASVRIIKYGTSQKYATFVGDCWNPLT